MAYIGQKYCKNENKVEIENRKAGQLHFFVKKCTQLAMVVWLVLVSTSVFAVDNIYVQGITGTYSTANGTYVFDGTDDNSLNTWKFVNGANTYYICRDADQYWDICTDKNNPLSTYIFFSENYGATSPLGDYWHSAADPYNRATGVEVIGPAPEIGVIGNGNTIIDGNTTTSFSNHTKYGSVDYSSGTVTRTYSISNTGLTPLTISGVSVTGTNSGDFAVTSSPASSVAASGSTTFSVRFDPSAVGSRTATINITSNDADEATYNFDIEGWGYTPSNLVVSGLTIPSAMNGIYEHQGVLNGQYEYWKHTTVSYYIYRDVYETDPGWWYIDSDTDKSTYLYRQYYSAAPTTAKDVNTWANPSVQLCTITIVDYVAAPEIVVNGNTVSISSSDATPITGDHTHFGTAEVGSGSITRTFTFQNTGGTNLQLTGSSPYIDISGTNAADFTVTTIPTTPITSGNSTTFQITFAPMGEGSRTATISIANNDSDESPFTFDIKGGGVYAKGLVLSGVTSDPVVNGNYTYQGITDGFAIWVHTSGTYRMYNHLYPSPENRYWCIDTDMNPDNGVCFTTLTNNNPSPTGATTEWTAGGSIAGHWFSGNPSVVYYASEMDVTGNGVSIASGDVTPITTDYTDFGSVLASSGSVSHSFTILNTGQGPLYLTGSPKVTLSGTNAADFTATTQPTSPVAATSGTTTFTVLFDPTGTGIRTATIAVANDDSDESPYTFSIQGTGTLAPAITTQAISNIGTTNAIGNGNITDLGIPSPTAYGICYGATSNPTISGNKVDKGATSATGAFTAQLTGLTPGTTYHARAFATNSVGTSYGDDVTFTTTASMTEPGNALNFDGTDDYVVATDNDNGLTAFTIEAWVKWDPSAATNIQFICGKGLEQMELHTGSGANDLRFIPTTGVYLDADNVLPTGVWTHVAVVYKPSESLAKMYINGVEVSLVNHGANPLSTAIANTATPFYLGSRSDATYRFKGSIDEVRVWNTVRSEAEIQSDRITAISSSSGLLCSYNFDEGTTGSTMLPDLTGNGNNGTLTNFALTGTTSNWVESYAMVVPTATAASDATVSGFTINWNAPSVGTVNNYKLYVATDAAFTSLITGYDPQTVASPATSSAVTGLASNTTYYYCICADKTTVTGEGARSNILSATTLPTPPTVTTQAVTSISVTTATGNGNITVLGNPTPTQYGVVWGTSENPTVNLQTKTAQGTASGTGAFTSSITGLSAATTYHLRAYATNSAGTSYGDDVTFTTLTAGTYIGTDTDWNTASNWAGNSVPTSGTDVTIPLGKTVIIGSTATADCNNLTIGGNLTIESSDAGTGSLIVSGTTSGNATVQRYMASGGWHLIASPAPGQTVGTFLTNNTTISFNPGNTSQHAMKDYNETSNNWNALLYDNSAATMEVGHGYGVWPDANGTVSFTGTLQSGDKNITVNKEGYGWNCIGNPYTSAIAINSGASASNNFIDLNISKFISSYEAIYVWQQSPYGYVPINHSYNSGGAYYIPVGQAFFVRTKATDSFSFTQAMQSHQNGAAFKNAVIEPSTISIEAKQNSKLSLATVKFMENCTNGLDVGYDAGAMKTGFDVFTRLVDDNGVDFALQCLSSVGSEDYSIPVGIETTEAGKLTLKFTPLNLASNYKLMLEDRLNGTNRTINTTVTVDVAAGTTLGRFYLSLANTTSAKVPVAGKALVSQFNGRIIVSGILGNEVSATLYDVQGRKIQYTKLNKGANNEISTQKMANGIYLLEIKDRGNVTVKRIAINNR